jgi:hypothetical protein
MCNYRPGHFIKHHYSIEASRKGKKKNSRRASTLQSKMTASSVNKERKPRAAAYHVAGPHAGARRE